MPAQSSPPRTDLRQHLRVFFSADLVSGTAYKVKHPTTLINGAQWPDRFHDVFAAFPVDLATKVRAAQREDPRLPTVLAPPRVWKFNGDEILLRDHVYLTSEGGDQHFAMVVQAFTGLVQEYDRRLRKDGMGMRGTVWTAGFPLRNRILRIRQGRDIPTIVTDDSPPPDFITGHLDGAGLSVLDFIGPDMDLGFRIAAYTPPARVSCSLDVAWLLSQDADASGVYHVGWRRMKGVADGAPYPLLWLPHEAMPIARHPWDGSDAEAMPETRAFVADHAKHLLMPGALRKLAREIWDHLGPHLVEPYTELPVKHAHTESWAKGIDHPGVIDLDLLQPDTD
jgi:hypothetical protein